MDRGIDDAEINIDTAPLTISPKNERTLSRLFVGWRIGARVSATIKGRDYFGKVTRKKEDYANHYVVDFDDSPSTRRVWQSRYLTVLPESWKDPPPARFLKDLKEPERLQTRVSYYHGGKQFVGTVKSATSKNRGNEYIVDFDAGKELSFKSNK